MAFALNRTTETESLLNRAANELDMPHLGEHYWAATLIESGANTSKLPNQHKNALVGAAYGIGFEVAVAVAIFVLYEIFHALKHLL